MNALTTPEIKKKAIEIARYLADYHWSKQEVFAAKIYYGFKATNGWFQKWTKRFRLSRRNRTSQEAPLTLTKPFETHMRKKLVDFYYEVDCKLEKIEKKLKRANKK